MKNINKYFGLLLVFTFIFLSGCSGNDLNNQYLKDAKQFNKIYFETVECIDLTNTIRSLEEFQSPENRKRIEELGLLVKAIKQNVPKEKEMLYKYNFKPRYEDLHILLKSYPRLGKLTQDERGEIDRIFTTIGRYRADWNDQNSSTIWK